MNSYGSGNTDSLSASFMSNSNMSEMSTAYTGGMAMQLYSQTQDENEYVCDGDNMQELEPWSAAQKVKNDLEW